jgi:hypothetical protein
MAQKTRWPPSIGVIGWPPSLGSSMAARGVGGRPRESGLLRREIAVSPPYQGLPQAHRSADGARVVPNLLTYVLSGPLIT